MANAVGDGDVRTLTFSADTSAMADNDVIAAPQEIPGFFRNKGGIAYIHSVVLTDDDDQGTDVELVFMNASGSIGAENSAYAPTDAVLGTVVGTVLLENADYSDATNGQTLTKANIGLMVKAAMGDDSIYVGAVCRSGTPTYSAEGLTVQIGVMY